MDARLHEPFDRAAQQAADESNGERWCLAISVALSHGKLDRRIGDHEDTSVCRPVPRVHGVPSPPSQSPGSEVEAEPAVLRRPALYDEADQPRTRSSASLGLRQSASQDLGEDDRVVVFGISSRVDERQRAHARPPPESGETRAVST